MWGQREVGESKRVNIAYQSHGRCESFRRRSLDPILPIRRVPMKMSHRQNECLFWINAINETIWKALQKITPIFAFVDRLQLWELLHSA